MLEALEALSAGVGVHLGIEDHNIDVVAGSQNVIQAAVTDVICPAVAAEDPEALLGQVLLILQDLFRFIAAAGFQSSDQGLGRSVVGLGVVLGFQVLVDERVMAACQAVSRDSSAGRLRPASTVPLIRG